MSEQRVHRTASVWLLIALVALEALVISAVFGWLIVQLFSSTPESFRSAVALTALVGVIAAWLIATTIGLMARSRWSRGSAVTWQVLQMAIAYGATQGDRPNWMVAPALFVPAVVVILLTLKASVRAQFGAGDSDERR